MLEKFRANVLNSGSEDSLCCKLLEWKLHVDLTVKQVQVLLLDWKGL